MSFADRIRETVSFTGQKGVSDTITLPGSAASGYDPFSRRYNTGTANIPVVIAHRSQDEWQACYCTYSSANTLTVNSIIATSNNPDSAVNFSGGDKDVYVAYTSDLRFPNTGLKVLDSDASHALTLSSGALTADRKLTITTGSTADRTLDISAANVTITAAGAALVDDANAKAQQETLGTFDTVAAVNSSTIDSNVNHIRTAGYYSANDGGGALYKRVAGTPTAGVGTKYITSSGGQRWEVAQGPQVNVLQYGAVADGTTPDTTAFNNAAADITGPVLVPPNKQYNYGGTVAFQYGIGLWDVLESGNTPYDTMYVRRSVASVGSSSQQNGGVIVRSTVDAGVKHNEFGFFSVLDSSSTDAAMEHVGVYSQVTSLNAGASVLWGGVFEVRNTTPSSGGTSVDHVLCGIEVDVVNNKSFSDVQKKIGVEVIGFGGGESTEAFSVYAANNTWANATYNSGGFRYGLRLNTNSINATLGSAILVATDHARALHITGVAAGATIDLDASAATTFGIVVRSNYTVPIAVQPNKMIRLAGEGTAKGIEYSSALDAVVLTAPSMGVTGHTTYTAATAGTNGDVPAQVDGYVGFYVNGTLKKVPYYNA
jgi:hypothetical protein